MTERRHLHGAPADSSGPVPGAASTAVPPVDAVLENPVTELADASSIAARATRGGLTYVLRNVLIQVVQVVSALALAHSVSPSGYGLVALGLGVCGAMRFVGDFGVLYFLVVQRDVAVVQERAAMLIALTNSIVFLSVAIVGGLWLMPTDSGTPLSELVLPALALGLPIEALRQTAVLRLERDMAYVRLGSVAVVEAFVLYGVQVVLMLLGAGIWGLVAGQVIGRVVGTAMLTRGGRMMARPGGVAAVRSLVRAGIPFQIPMVVVGILGLVAPVLVLAALDTESLGYWGWSSVIAAPVISLTIVIHQVATPALARLRRFDDARSDEAADFLLRLMVLIAALFVGAGLGLVPGVVEFVFGSTWVPAIDAVRVALLAVVPIGASRILAARVEVGGRMRERARATVVAGVVTALTVYPLSKAFGVGGAAFATAFLFPAIECAVLASVADLPLRRASQNAVIALGVAAGLSFATATLVTNLPTLLLAVVLTAVGIACVAPFVDRLVWKRSVGLLRPSTGSGV